MVVGFSELQLHLPGCSSLKDKRQIIKSVKDRLHNRFNVSVSEVDHHELWQRATLGVACVSRTNYQAKKTLARVVKQVENLNKAVVLNNTITIFSPE